MKLDSQVQLRQLKSKMEMQDLSLLVGAGFSRNVSDRFLLWSQLLMDACKYLFEKEIKKEFNAYSSTSSKAIDYYEFLKGELSARIDTVGYLGIISRYIKKHGYNESIAIYIEKRTPRLIQVGGKLLLRVMHDEEIVDTEIPVEKLSLHQMVVNLPWNNIYTTNYDNLLEYCINHRLRAELEERITTLETEIAGLEQRKTKISHSISEMNEQRSVTNDVPRGEFINGKDSITQGQTQADFERQKEYNKLEAEMTSIDYMLKDSIDKLSRLRILMNECQSVVTDSAELAIKQKKNVIKLHGTLRGNADSPFGFDGDPRGHYIISQKDYESYPRKHEAFTQLMRISLLQQSFCLIGFSGDDPNFLGWIAWVRDIVEKNSRHQFPKDDYKIYLISLSTSPISPEKNLLYQNHRVACVQLNDDVVHFLEGEVGRRLTEKDNFHKLELFFDFLKINGHVNKPEVALETMKYTEFESFWRNLPIRDPNARDAGKIANRVLDEPLFDYNRLPAVQLSENSQLNYLFQFSKKMFLDANESGKAKLVKLLTQALRSQYLPSSLVFYPDSTFDGILQFAEEHKLEESQQLLKLALKDALWTNNTSKFQEFMGRISAGSASVDNEIYYWEILQKLFNLKFDEALLLIERWDAKGPWLINKAGLLALYDTSKANEIIRNQRFPILRDEMLRLNLLKFIRRTNFGRPDKNLSEQIQTLKSEGLKDIYASLDYLLGKINRQRTKVEPFGSGVYSITTEMNTNGNQVYALTLIGYLIDCGFPVTVPSMTLVDQDEFYKAVQLSFTYCPFPALYFAVLCSNSNLLRRVGQDFAFSEHITREEIIQISTNVQKAFLDPNTPARIKINLLDFYSEVIETLSPEIWNDFFLSAWNQLEDLNRLFSQRFSNRDKFITNGLRYCNDEKVFTVIISSCLHVINTGDDHAKDAAITYLYKIALNSSFKKFVDKIRASMDVQNQLETTISKMIELKHWAVFAFGNLSEVLTLEQRNQVQDKLAAMDLKLFENVRVWTLLFYQAEKKQLAERIKVAMLTSQGLWDSGIRGTHASLMHEFIPINRLIKLMKERYDLVPTQSEIEITYEKLKTELNKIESFIGSGSTDDLLRYDDILQEMQDFLSSQSDRLSLAKDFREIQAKVESLYNNQRAFGSISDGLLSSDENTILRALAELSKRIYNGNFAEDIDLIRLATSKVLMRSQPALFATLGYVARWFFDFSAEPSAADCRNLLANVVAIYKKEYPNESDHSFVEEQMARISVVLAVWGERSEAVEYFVKKLHQSRYLNVRIDLPSETAAKYPQFSVGF